MLTLFFAISCTFFSFAQVSEAEKPMSTGVENALSIRLLNTTEKDVEKIWKTYTKDYKGKMKKDRKTGEIFTDNANIPELSSNTVDLFAKMTTVGEEVMFSVWFDLGGSFLSSQTHADKYGQAEKILLLFALEVSQKTITDELGSEEDILKKQTKELEQLEKENTKLHSNIEDYKKKIAEAEAAIEKNVAEQENKKVEIQKQEVVVGKVKKKLSEVKN